MHWRACGGVYQLCYFGALLQFVIWIKNIRVIYTYFNQCKAYCVSIVVIFTAACNLQISEEDVSLQVNSELLNTYLGEPLDVEFTFNR